MSWEPRAASVRQLPGGYIVSLFSDGSEREFVHTDYQDAELLMRRWMKREVKDFKALGVP